MNVFTHADGSSTRNIAEPPHNTQCYRTSCTSHAISGNKSSLRDVLYVTVDIGRRPYAALLMTTVFSALALKAFLLNRDSNYRKASRVTRQHIDNILLSPSFRIERSNQIFCSHSRASDAFFSLPTPSLFTLHHINERYRK